jgi:hypothetical protein
MPPVFAHSSDDYIDYLDTMSSQMGAATTFDTRFDFGVPQDDFDDYMNQLSEYMLYWAVKISHYS